MTLDTQVEKNFKASKFVQETLTIPANLAVIRNSAIADRLMLQIEDAVAYCFEQMEKQNLGDESEYGQAISLLMKKRDTIVARYGSSYRTNSKKTKVSTSRAYKAQYGSMVINSDGVPAGTYAH
jgi:hypothetical protein